MYCTAPFRCRAWVNGLHVWRWHETRTKRVWIFAFGVTGSIRVIKTSIAPAATTKRDLCSLTRTHYKTFFIRVPRSLVIFRRNDSSSIYFWSNYWTLRIILAASYYITRQYDRFEFADSFHDSLSPLARGCANDSSDPLRLSRIRYSRLIWSTRTRLLACI